jgi:hypothetical protein
MAQVGLRVSEARMLDLDDVRWELYLGGMDLLAIQEALGHA